MKRFRADWNIRIVEGEGSEAGKKIAFIDEAPEFRAVGDSLASVALAVSEYTEAVKRFGPKPNPLLIEYQRQPSLETWLACRRAGLMPPLPEHGGSKWLGHSQAVLGKHGISENDFIGILDAQDDAISKICTLLLENLARSRRMKSSGETHLGRRGAIIPFEIADWLIHCMLDGLEWYGIDEVPYDLKALIRFRLIPGDSKVDEHRKLKENRLNAARLGGRMVAEGKTPSYRAVAATLEVTPSTVKRWFKSVDEFKSQAVRLSVLFGKDGLPRDVVRDAKALHAKDDAQHS
jgi:hypothetical protein